MKHICACYLWINRQSVWQSSLSKFKHTLATEMVEGWGVRGTGGDKIRNKTFRTKTVWVSQIWWVIAAGVWGDVNLSTRFSDVHGGGKCDAVRMIVVQWWRSLADSKGQSRWICRIYILEYRAFCVVQCVNIVHRNTNQMRRNWCGEN